tara:strand:- start:3042 stop:4742 length:1701 start_codon:yes stop_codon:yes gene_type:complete
MNINMENDRECARTSYKYAEANNKRLYDKGDVKATDKYIYDNQKEDALEIVKKFHENRQLRVISIIKQCKVGMDGLMIELNYQMTTHPDDNFILSIDNVYIITGMSNKEWEDNLKDKIPQCFQKNVYHHGKLMSKGKLTNSLSGIKDALIIIDEIDTGDKQMQKLHRMLIESGIFNKEYIQENNIRFVMVSATMKNQLYELNKWSMNGVSHDIHKMKIPKDYVSIEYLKTKKYLDQYYPLNSEENIRKWIQEDIIDNYGDDIRLHFVRCTVKNIDLIKGVSSNYGLAVRDHTSENRIPEKDLEDYFSQELESHMIILVKGFYRRSNLIPNSWKMKIGAMHESWVKNPSTETEVQAFPGRMCGYWKSKLDNGHKFGPIRTNLESMEEYINWYNDPESQFIKKTNTMVSAKNIGIKLPPSIRKYPIIKDEWKGKKLFTENECNPVREEIRKYQIEKRYIPSPEIPKNGERKKKGIGGGKFRALSTKFFEKDEITGLFKYSYPKNTFKKLWTPDEITKDHTNLCNITSKTNIHNLRIIERRPTYEEVNGIKELRYKIFYYDGVEEKEEE